jgi:uncharacterized protein YggE
MPDHIEVIGSGVAQSRPDLFVARLGAEATAADVAAALGAAQSASAAMAVAARARGASDSDLRTTEVSVQTDYGANGPQGYRASLGIELTLHDVDIAGALLADIVASGGDASRVHSVAMTLADAQPLLDAAREAAFADAQHQAEQLAALAGRVLGGVRRVSPPAVAVPFARAIAVSGGRRQSGAIPVEPGSTALTVSLQVRFDLV